MHHHPWLWSVFEFACMLYVVRLVVIVFVALVRRLCGRSTH